ncbi:putative signal peptide protein [Puccinia sorghi]|uniref:Putative signal peptide protein n=1 Tax=Puccinia sorghi TaxID=27349 RepID=A0A0L6VGD4_9BASI|nr:putative signal peptide protein [Puccinia sorghi]
MIYFYFFNTLIILFISSQIFEPYLLGRSNLKSIENLTVCTVTVPKILHRQTCGV